MKFNLNKNVLRSTKFFILFILLANTRVIFLSAEDLYLDQLEIDSSTKLDTNSSDLPSNPFEIVEMIRRVNSMNDATKPSDAVDDALKLFNKIEEKENL